MGSGERLTKAIAVSAKATLRPQGTETQTPDGVLRAHFRHGRATPSRATPVRREASATVFAAIHEPYEGRPKVEHVRRLAETPVAAAVLVQAPEFTDYLVVAFDDQEQTLTCATGEAFTFAGYGYVRIEKSGIRASGKLGGFRVRLPASTTGTEATINGKQERIEKAEGFSQWGKLPKQPADRRGSPDPAETADRQVSAASGRPSVAAVARSGDRPQQEGDRPQQRLAKQPSPTTTNDATEDSPERAAAVHYRFQPEEAHLVAGGQKEIEMHLRCVGEGQTAGRLRLVAPPDLNVEPGAIEVAPITEGQERVVRFKVQAGRDGSASSANYQCCPIRA